MFGRREQEQTSTNIEQRQRCLTPLHKAYYSLTKAGVKMIIQVVRLTLKATSR